MGKRQSATKADDGTPEGRFDDQPRRAAIDPNADLVQFYFRDIRPVSTLLTLEEEQTLSRAVQEGKQAQLRLRRKPEITGDERARLESLTAASTIAPEQ